jgi:hypothetical protein
VLMPGHCVAQPARCPAAVQGLTLLTCAGRVLREAVEVLDKAMHTVHEKAEVRVEHGVGLHRCLVLLAQLKGLSFAVR